MSKEIKILNGPSREELFDGLRLFSEKRIIQFTFPNGLSKCLIPVFMRNIGVERQPMIDPDLWVIHFIIERKDLPLFEPWYSLKRKSSRKEVISLEVSYSTKTRKGVVSGVYVTTE